MKNPLLCPTFLCLLGSIFTLALGDGCGNNICGEGERCSMKEGSNSHCSCSCSCGTDCENQDDTEECLVSPCQNGGTFVQDGPTNFHCECPPGLEGSLCGEPGDCRAGWYGYKGSCYRFMPLHEPFQTARSRCEAQNAHLLTIDTAEENEFLRKVYVRDYVYGVTSKTAVWIGGQSVNGDWRWITSQEPVCPCINWDRYNFGECLAYHFRYNSHYGRVYGFYCYAYRDYICEYEVEGNEDAECVPTPCQNGAQFVLEGSSSFSCQCAPGYHGVTCQHLGESPDPIYECREGWFDNRGSCYKYFNSMVNFETARLACDAEESHLLTIETTAEQEFLRHGYMYDNVQSVGYAAVRGLWVGGQHIDGDWRWITSQEPVCHCLLWHKRGPESTSNGLCLAYTSYVYFNYERLEDHYCSLTHPYVCEYEHPGGSTYPPDIEQMSGCRTHWYHHEGSCYKFFPSRGTYIEVRSWCQNEQAHLLTIDNDAEEKFLRDTYIPRSVQRVSIDTLIWVDGYRGSGSTYLSSCVAYAPQPGPSYGQVSDLTCISQRAYVCEYELSGAA